MYCIVLYCINKNNIHFRIPKLSKSSSNAFRFCLSPIGTIANISSMAAPDGRDASAGRRPRGRRLVPEAHERHGRRPRRISNGEAQMHFVLGIVRHGGWTIARWAARTSRTGRRSMVARHETPRPCRLKGIHCCAKICRVSRSSNFLFEIFRDSPV